MIGRVYSAHPGEGERFFLRMLLNHVIGCTSYEDIRTLSDGTVCDSYKAVVLNGGATAPRGRSESLRGR